MQQEIKGVGLNPNTHIQLTDHLAPLCAILNIPLLLTDATHATEASKNYPGLKVLLIDWIDFTLENLVQNFDVFFQSEFWNRNIFYKKVQKLEQKFNKSLRNVHCPHGFSDKIFWLENGVWEDILLVYGENMMDLFKHQQIESHLNTVVRIGNYRYTYYQHHQTFYNQLLKKLLENKLNLQKKTILYAPTCYDQEHSTSLLHAEELLKNLPTDYNLIVKFHPKIDEIQEMFVKELVKKYNNLSNILFLESFTLIYPLLSFIDIYVGDRSSIGYDFLAFNRPMFFLNQLERNSTNDRNLFLYRCGTEIQPNAYKDFYKILDKSLYTDSLLYSKIRQNIYYYTFEPSISFNQIKKTIEASYFSPKKLKSY